MSYEGMEKKSKICIIELNLINIYGKFYGRQVDWNVTKAQRAPICQFPLMLLLRFSSIVIAPEYINCFFILSAILIYKFYLQIKIEKLFENGFRKML
jgi:hypothetical protein